MRKHLDTGRQIPITGHFFYSLNHRPVARNNYGIISIIAHLPGQIAIYIGLRKVFGRPGNLRLFRLNIDAVLTGEKQKETAENEKMPHSKTFKAI